MSQLRTNKNGTPNSSRLAEILLQLRDATGPSQEETVLFANARENNSKNPIDSSKIVNGLGYIHVPKYMQSQSQASQQSLSQSENCNCRKSKCLKLYCQCFAIQAFCSSMCRCAACENTSENVTVRNEAVKYILDRNPTAFESKFKNSDTSSAVPIVAHKIGCRCRKSSCLKKYCECFNASVSCNPSCTCLSCCNTVEVDMKTAPSNSSDPELQNRRTNDLNFGKDNSEFVGEDTVSDRSDDEKSTTSNDNYSQISKRARISSFSQDSQTVVLEQSQDDNDCVTLNTVGFEPVGSMDEQLSVVNLGNQEKLEAIMERSDSNFSYNNLITSESLNSTAAVVNTSELLNPNVKFVQSVSDEIPGIGPVSPPMEKIRSIERRLSFKQQTELFEKLLFNELKHNPNSSILNSFFNSNESNSNSACSSGSSGVTGDEEMTQHQTSEISPGSTNVAEILSHLSNCSENNLNDSYNTYSSLKKHDIDLMEMDDVKDTTCQSGDFGDQSQDILYNESPNFVGGRESIPSYWPVDDDNDIKQVNKVKVEDKSNPSKRNFDKIITLPTTTGTNNENRVNVRIDHFKL
eukprot:gene5396-7480_t